MKKVVFVILTIVITACSQSPEQKANALIQEKVKNSLYHPETYEAVETVIDSAFAPKDDPVFHEKILKLYHLCKDVQKNQEKANDAERSMSLWKSPYMSEYGHIRYNEAKQEYDDCVKQKEKLINKIQKTNKELEKIAEPGRRFIGFKVTHKFRAQNNAGNTLMGEYVFILNEDLTKILASYDTDSEDYIGVQAFYQHLEEAEEEAEEVEEEAEEVEEEAEEAAEED